MHDATRLALLEVLDKRRPETWALSQCIDLALRLNTMLRRVQLDIIGELLSTDSLTGCASRRGMLTHLREEQARSTRIGAPAACVCWISTTSSWSMMNAAILQEMRSCARACVLSPACCANTIPSTAMAVKNS